MKRFVEGGDRTQMLRCCPKSLDDYALRTNPCTVIDALWRSWICMSLALRGRSRRRRGPAYHPGVL